MYVYLLQYSGEKQTKTRLALVKLDLCGFQMWAVGTCLKLLKNSSFAQCLSYHVLLSIYFLYLMNFMKIIVMINMNNCVLAWLFTMF